MWLSVLEYWCECLWVWQSFVWVCWDVGELRCGLRWGECVWLWLSLGVVELWFECVWLWLSLSVVELRFECVWLWMSFGVGVL